ncbi:MAG: hypothetical protein AAFW74_04900, partial [Pseudomonadota bacterium]
EGLGITGLSGLEVNDKVTVKRMVGDDIAGRIQRIDKNWAGIVMDKTLLADDPLYSLVAKNN